MLAFLLSALFLLGSPTCGASPSVSTEGALPGTTIPLGTDARTLALDTVDAPAEPATPSASWNASLRYGMDRISSGRESWNGWTGTLQRSAGSTTWVLQGRRIDRFGTSDAGGAVGVWHTLWAGGYAHIEASLAPQATVIARRAATAEFYQGWNGWEASVRYRWRRYASESVHFVGLGAARYVGSWYLQGRAGITPRSAGTSTVARLSVRRYLGSSASYLDAQAGFGRTVAVVAPGTLDEGTVYFGAVRWHQFVTSHLGLSFGLQYSDQSFYQRSGLTAGLLARW